MLSERSKQIRRDTLKLSQENGGYHYGGSFSCVEILIALFDETLKEDDRFILSKGHACWPYYVLLREKGFNPVLEGHPKRDPHNEIYCSTGSLGHGLPTAVGMAMAKKIKKESGQIYVLMGDGECQEGTTWESLLIASHYELSNLTVIVDWNKIQGSGFVKDILKIGSYHLNGFKKIVESVKWDVFSVDGHDIDSILKILNPTNPFVFILPKLVIAETVKGRGISFMRNKPEWHAKFIIPGSRESEQAWKELS